MLLLCVFVFAAGKTAGWVAAGLALAFVAGAFAGYRYRARIAADISKIQVQAWISDLEQAGERDVAKLRSVVSSVLGHLKSKL